MLLFLGNYKLGVKHNMVNYELKEEPFYSCTSKCCVNLGKGKVLFPLPHLAAPVQV